jgi:hypothetical protein
LEAGLSVAILSPVFAVTRISEQSVVKTPKQENSKTNIISLLLKVDLICIKVLDLRLGVSIGMQL